MKGSPWLPWMASALALAAGVVALLLLGYTPPHPPWLSLLSGTICLGTVSVFAAGTVGGESRVQRPLIGLCLAWSALAPAFASAPVPPGAVGALPAAALAVAAALLPMVTALWSLFCMVIMVSATQWIPVQIPIPVLPIPGETPALTFWLLPLTAGMPALAFGVVYRRLRNALGEVVLLPGRRSRANIGSGSAVVISGHMGGGGNGYAAPGVRTEAGSQFANKQYNVRRESDSQKGMQQILETVVFFMSRNFKGYSSLGFLAAGGGSRFVLNAWVSKSEHLKTDATVTLGGGMLGTALKKSSGFLTGELRSYNQRLEYYSRGENINSLVAMPVKDAATGVVLGALSVDSERFRAFNDEHKELMNRFAHIAAALISNARLTEQVRRAAKWSDTLYYVSKNLGKMLKPQAVMSALGEVLIKVFRGDRVVLCVYSGITGKAKIWSVLGETGGLSRGMEFDPADAGSIYARAFRFRTEQWMTEFASNTSLTRFGAGNETEPRPRELIVAPLVDNNEAVLAVVGLESSRVGAYSERERKMLNTLLGNFSESLSKARAYSELERLATIDGLTQIPNHRRFQEILAIEFKRAERYAQPFTLLLLDVDHFKKVNDTYGHTAGDAVLKTVASTLLENIRETDYCARYGGEEFVVLMVQADESQSRALAERLRGAVEDAEVPYQGQILKVTASFGGASFPHDVASKQELIDLADKAMYHSKEHGRNRVTFVSAIAAQPDLAGG